MPRLPQRPSLNHLRHQAKQFLKLYRRGEPVAADRLRDTIPRLVGKSLRLRDALTVIAAEHRFSSWSELKHHVERLQAGRRTRTQQLSDAARSGDIDIVQRLLADGVGALESEMDYGPTSPLRSAVAGNDARCVAALLDAGAPTAVWEYDALKHADNDTVRQLLKQRRDLENQLVHALKDDKEDTALALLDQCPALANAFHDSPRQEGPLMLAAKHGHGRAAQRLLHSGARVDSNVHNSRRTALTYAIVHQHHDIADLIRDASGVSYAVNEYHYAAELGDLDGVLRYLARGMDVNATDDICHHVLPHAIRSGNRKLVDELVSRGADINLAWGWERYIWFDDVIEQGDIETIRLIIDLGVDVNHHSAQGTTPRSLCRKYQQPAIEALFIERGATA